MDDRVNAEIRGFLARYISNHDLADDEDIFAAGFVNSLFAMQLVLFIERRFETILDNEDLVLDNFRTIAAMTRLVERKRDLPPNP